MANNTAVAGHVHVADGAILGGGTLVHQFCRIGQYAMTAAGTVVLQDIPAFVTCSGNRAEAHGMNVEGMRRRGVDTDVINRLREFFCKKTSLCTAIFQNETKLAGMQFRVYWHDT